MNFGVTAIDAAAYLGRAKLMEPAVARWRDEAERQRSLPTGLFEAIRESGLFHVWSTSGDGGAIPSPAAMLPAVEELARQDGSVGWSVAVGIDFGLMNRHFPSGMVPNGPDCRTVLAGSIQSKGTALSVDGGYRVSGRWPLVTNCNHSAWLILSCRIYDGAVARLDEDGSPQVRFFWLPLASCQIIDSWYSLGLRGTGSHDVEANNVFVPEGLRVDLSPQAKNEMSNLGGASLGAVALGIARSAMDEVLQLLDAAPIGSQRAVICEHLATAEGLLRSARAFLFDAVGTVSEALEEGREVTDDEMSVLKSLAIVTCARHASAAVDLVFSVGGSRSILAINRLERCLRDINTVKGHGAVGLRSTTAIGHFLLNARRRRPTSLG